MDDMTSKRLFLLDMDGTIYIGDKLFDGAAAFLSYVKNSGGKYIFLTNNSSKGTEDYIAKLARMGIEAEPEEFLTSVDAAIVYIHKHFSDSKFFVCGTSSLKSQLRAAGIQIAEHAEPDVDAVLLGYDTELTYEKLENCCILLNRGCSYIATHADMVCPAYYGSAPDCGSVIEMLRTATGRLPAVIGKPQPEMAYAAMERTGFSKEQSCLIGDRLYTDIACGINAGIDTVFVLSGEGRLEDIERLKIRPRYIYQNIAELLEELTKGEK